MAVVTVKEPRRQSTQDERCPHHHEQMMLPCPRGGKHLGKLAQSSPADRPGWQLADLSHGIGLTITSDIRIYGQPLINPLPGRKPKTSHPPMPHSCPYWARLCLPSSPLPSKSCCFSGSHPSRIRREAPVPDVGRRDFQLSAPESFDPPRGPFAGRRLGWTAEGLQDELQAPPA